MAPVISTRDLTKRWAGLTAVDHVNLEVSGGEIFGLVGPDGAGKTTILRMLCGLIEPSEGGATLAGCDVQRDPQGVAFYADLFGIAAAERTRGIPELLRMTRMEPFRKRQAGRLSGGMRQKLALMCTLLHRPQILLLDEPTNGVDPVSRRDFWAILYQLVKTGITVFVTTAYLDEAERCNRVGLMNRGRLIDCAAPEALRHKMGEGCYEVRTGDQRAARLLLQRSEGVTSVEFFGAALHLFMEPSRTSPDAFMLDLERSGLGPASCQRIVPSLEDVFIAMDRRTGAGGEAN
jgi:ABC-2 type transport system ATP-binding protein